MPGLLRRRPPPRQQPQAPPQTGTPVQDFGSNEQRVEEIRTGGQGLKEDSWMDKFLEEQYGLEKAKHGYAPIGPDVDAPAPVQEKAPAKKKGLLHYLNPLNWFRSEKEPEAGPVPKPKGLPGTRFAGVETKAKKKLGTGGFGTVFQTGLFGKDVAVKYPDSYEMPSEKKDFERELRIQAMLPKGEENLVSHMGSTSRKRGGKETPGMVMEYAPHGGMDKMLQNFRTPDKNAPEKTTTDLPLRLLTRDALRGLSALHGKNLVHGDIKGENILVGKNYTGKVADFGKLRKEGSSEDVDIGTDPFSAPENLTNAPTRKSDVWAMGETMLQGLTGRTSVGMMNAKKPTDKVPQSRNASHTQAKAKNPDFFSKELPKLLGKQGVDPQAIELLKGMLEVDPEKRLTAEKALESEYLQLSEDEEKQAKALMAQVKPKQA